MRIKDKTFEVIQYSAENNMYIIDLKGKCADELQECLGDNVGVYLDTYWFSTANYKVTDLKEKNGNTHIEFTYEV